MPTAPLHIHGSARLGSARLSYIIRSAVLFFHSIRMRVSAFIYQQVNRMSRYLLKQIIPLKWKQYSIFPPLLLVCFAVIGVLLLLYTVQDTLTAHISHHTHTRQIMAKLWAVTGKWVPFKVISIEDDVSKFIDAQYWTNENVFLFAMDEEQGCTE